MGKKTYVLTVSACELKDITAWDRLFFGGGVCGEKKMEEERKTKDASETKLERYIVI